MCACGNAKTWAAKSPEFRNSPCIIQGFLLLVLFLSLLVSLSSVVVLMVVVIVTSSLGPVLDTSVIVVSVIVLSHDVIVSVPICFHHFVVCNYALFY